MASAGSVQSQAPGSKNNERFNAEAAAWDSNPFVHAMSAEAWKAIQKYTPYFPGDSAAATTSTSGGVAGKQPDVLEVGCGTGLLSMMVAPRCHRMVAVDAAEGMVEVLRAKLTKPDALKNVVPVAVLLEDPEDEHLPPASSSSDAGPRLKFDLITSHLVLHHIPELAPVLSTMFGCLKPGGMVALTDFEDFGPEARRFHPESKMDGVERHGIPRTWMEGLMREAGFVDVEVKVAWESEKSVEQFPGEFGKDGKGEKERGKGEMMKFSYVICLGKKP
jgi:SAM-dependent methyltransferase